MSTDRAVVKLALILTRKYESQHAAYLAEREYDMRRGMRAQYCEHGTYLLTSHDPMCGGCEEGYSMADGLQRRTQALFEARQRMNRVMRITSAAIALRNEMPGFDMTAVIAEVKRLQNGE